MTIRCVLVPLPRLPDSLIFLLLYPCFLYFTSVGPSAANASALQETPESFIEVSGWIHKSTWCVCLVLLLLLPYPCAIPLCSILTLLQQTSWLYIMLYRPLGVIFYFRMAVQSWPLNSESAPYTHIVTDSHTISPPTIRPHT